MPRRIGGDVRLIDARKGERFDDPLVRPLHGERVLLVKGALVLIDHDAVLFERLEAVSVKFAGKEPFARAERIGRVYDDQIVFRLFPSHEFESVFNINVQARVV